MASIIKVDTIQSTTSNVFFQNSSGTEYARFDSSGNMGIGTALPSFKLHVDGIVNTTNYYNINTNRSTPAVDAALYRPTDGTLGFVANASERMRIDSAGRVLVGVGATAPVWDERVGSRLDTTGTGQVAFGAYSPSTSYATSLIRVQSENPTGAAWNLFDGRGQGGGIKILIDGNGLVDLRNGQIKFPATQNASSDANTLDDYEEGSWTPVITGTSTAGSATYSSQSGSYVKIGRYVFLQMFVVFTSAHTGTGGTKVGGFPFTIASSFGNGGTITYKTAWVTNGPDFMQGEATTNFGYLRYDTNTTQADITPNVNIQNTTGFMLSIWYLSDN